MSYGQHCPRCEDEPAFTAAATHCPWCGHHIEIEREFDRSTTIKGQFEELRSELSDLGDELGRLADTFVDAIGPLTLLFLAVFMCGVIVGDAVGGVAP